MKVDGACGPCLGVLESIVYIQEYGISSFLFLLDVLYIEIDGICISKSSSGILVSTRSPRKAEETKN